MNSKRLLKTLIIEDDFRFIDIFKLEASSYLDIHSCQNLNSAAELLHKNTFDLIIIDLNIHAPMDGIDFIEKNLNTGNTPFFVMSSDITQNSKIKSLQIGAADYLWKSMPSQEIQLRIERVFKNSIYKKIFELDNLSLNIESAIVTLNQTPVNISKNEYKLLLEIFKKHPQKIPKESLSKEIWGDQIASDGVLNTCIWQLNKKLDTFNYKIAIQKNQGIGFIEK